MKKVKLRKVKDYYGDNDYETTRLGFVHEGFFITEPFTSECGRFEVDPRKEYGLTVDQATEISEFNGDMVEFMSPAQSMGE